MKVLTAFGGAYGSKTAFGSAYGSLLMAYGAKTSCRFCPFRPFCPFSAALERSPPNH